MKKKTTGQKLKSLRGKRSRKDLASELGVSVSAVTMYELDERIPKDEVKKKYAKIFNSTVEALFFS